MLPLITSAVAVLVKEQRVHGPARGQSLALTGLGFLESSKLDIIQLWDAVKQPNVLFPTLFIFLWQSTPQSDSAMFYFTYVQTMIRVIILYFLFHPYLKIFNILLLFYAYLNIFIDCDIYKICNEITFVFSTNKLGFTPEFLGRVKLVTSVASLLGVGLYNGFLKNVPLRKIFVFTTVFGTALGMTQVCVMIYFWLRCSSGLIVFYYILSEGFISFYIFWLRFSLLLD